MLEQFGAKAQHGRCSHQAAVAVVKHEHTPLGAMESNHGREDLLQNVGQLDLVRETFAQGVEGRHVVELPCQLVSHLAQCFLVAVALDRRGQNVGHGLEEVSIVLRKGSRLIAEGRDRAERLLAPSS